LQRIADKKGNGRFVRRPKRKETIMMVLLLVFAGSLIYRITHPYRQETVTRLKYTNRSIAEKESRKTPTPAGLQLDQGSSILLGLVSNPPQHSGETSKNVFQMSSTTSASAPERPAMPEPSQVEEPVQNASDPVVQINEDLSRFTVFGVFESDEDKAVFLERGKDVLTVRRGDLIDGKFLVEEISAEKIVIRSKELDIPITLDISDFQ